MPSAPRRRAAFRRGVASVVAVLLLQLAVPLDATVEAARPGRDRPAAEGWGARRLERAVLPAGDRAALRALPARTRVAYHRETRRVRFLAGTREAPLTGGLAVARGGRPLDAAAAHAAASRFVRRFGSVFGASGSDRELRVMPDRTRLASARPAASRRHATTTVRFQQFRAGVPVLGGELAVRVSARGEVVSATGELLPRTARVRDRSRIGGAEAERIASAWLAREAGRSVAAVRARREGLAVHDPRILGGPALGPPWARRPRLVWRVDTAVAGPGARGASDHRLLLVDAARGLVVAAIGRGADVTRHVCDRRNVRRNDFRCVKPYTRSEGQPASGIGDVDSAYRLMGVVADWYRTRLGRDGIDDRGSRMKATVRYCPLSGCPWNNGQWDWAAQQAVFGRGWARADDIVGHEFTHGVLDHEARLFYYYQSGAINEMFADVFGELIDLSDPGGRDTTFTRWKIGEDTPIGIFRDMRDPPSRGHADRVRSPLWHTGSTDLGGVHRNSGVGNKAAYLIAAGGTFNGQTIQGIGTVRMGRLFYTVMSEWLTSASDYADLGDALMGACADLKGSFGFTAAHCTAVSRTVAATQMLLRPLEQAPSQAPVCGSTKVPADAFLDDFEDPGSGLWKHARLVGDRRGWYYPPNPNNDPTWDGTWASSGEMNLYGVDRPVRSDTVMRLLEGVTVPAGGYLRFEHGYSFDKGDKRWDGGLVEVSVDGGRWQGVDALFTHGGYNGRIAKGTGNPLGGRRAFTGDSHGYGASRIDLSSFAGRSIRLRFRVGTDRSGGGYGWYVDDVRLYACVTAPAA